MAQATKADQQEAKERLYKLLEPGDTIYTTLKHVSRSGMYRVIGMHVIKNNEPLQIAGIASDLLEGWDDRHYGAKASGCGMDMGFHLVYSLSRHLWPYGVPCTFDKCNSNDHRNGDQPPEGSCTGEGCTNLECKPWVHPDGGYALRHRWM